MFLRYLALVAMCAALAGCDQVSAMFTPASERINAAFPFADDLKVAQLALANSLEGDKAAQQGVTEQYKKLMDVRALTCTAKTPIGRFDNVSKIRGKVGDFDCFQKQDAHLAQWIALRRLALALAKPPLVPVTELPAKALLPNYAEYTGHIAMAPAANVLAVKGPQKLSIVQLPGGKQLSSFAAPEQIYKAPTLSPNGRVLAVAVGSRNLRLFEVETGNVLWNTEEYSEVIAWLPQLEAAILQQAPSGAPQLLDIKNARIDPYPATEKRLTWALGTPDAKGKYLVGSHQTASQMEVIRAASGALEAAPIKQWRITGNGISSTPFLMADGSKLVFPSSQDLNWLDMASDQQGTWQLSALGAQGFTKLNEQSVLFDAHTSGGTPPTTRVLDITQSTVAVAKNLEPRDGNLISLAPRNGYLKRGGSAVIIGSAVELDAPQALEPLVSEVLLARQLARINAQAAVSAPESSNTPERQAYIDTLSRQVRAMNTASAIRDGLPRDVVEAIRQGRGPNSSKDAAIAAAGVKPLLTDVPANAKVSVIGVYEGTQSTPGSRTGSVRVNVTPGNTPLVLVLSSYEPVRWTVNTGGRKISAILLSSYGESSVISPGALQILKIGSTYAYKMDSPEYGKLKQDVARYVANPVQSFQGSYKGQDFSVN